MVLVHVTTFKGCHKIQDQWENREYVVEKWPYPNVPVYVVHPRDRKGCSWTLHRNYLPAISPNLEQGEMDEPVVGVGNDASPTPVPPVGDAPVEAEPSGQSPQAQQVAHQKLVQIDLLHLGVALKPPGTSFLGDMGIWFGRCCWTDWHLGFMGWSTYQSNHGVLSVYHFLEGVQCSMHSTYNIKCLPSITHLSIKGNTLNETSQVDSWAGKGVGQRIFGPVPTPLPMKNSPKVIPVEV